MNGGMEENWPRPSSSAQGFLPQADRATWKGSPGGAAVPPGHVAHPLKRHGSCFGVLRALCVEGHRSAEIGKHWFGESLYEVRGIFTTGVAQKRAQSPNSGT